MTISIGRVISLAAVAAFTTTGLVEAAEQAAFHLPVAAHWGQVLLQPGDYKMYLPELSTGDLEILVKGADKAAFERPLVAVTHNVSASSYLKLRKVDGNYFVREFSFGPSGESFTFPIPKARYREQMTMRGDTSVTVAAR
ncbi:MAG TPA: hypothetical protein VHZ07_06640 [Bryobacteraceae bacterium]|jgi:hypothetical protein|nr:hypothetical protein [Bryobacteraceae bacterium]